MAHPKGPFLLEAVRPKAHLSSPSSNVSFATSTIHPDTYDVRVQWLVSMVFSTFMSVFLIYVILSLTVFAYRKKLRFKCGQRILEKKNGAALLSALTLICASAILLYFLAALPLYVPQKHPYCGVQQRITTTCGIVTFSSVYFALWFRVYSLFYSNPIIKKETRKYIRYLSKASVVLLLFMAVSTSIVFLTAPEYRTVDIGCLKIQSPNGNAIKWGMLVTSTVLFQATLLFLFVHPLYLHHKQMLHHGFDSRSVIPVVKRAFITAAVCIVSDTAQAVYAIANSQSLGYVRHTAYGVNMVVNLVALICSFADWRRRLLPCRTSKRQLSRQSTKLTHVSSISIG